MGSLYLFFLITYIRAAHLVDVRLGKKKFNEKKKTVGSIRGIRCGAGRLFFYNFQCKGGAAAATTIPGVV